MNVTVTTAPGAETPGRRELNKARTREAIVAALRTLVYDQPVHRVTVDQLAEAAGISRRTFFNYYAGIPGVVSEIIGSSTEHLADGVGDLDPSVSPLQPLRRLVAEVGIPTELIEWLALLDLHACADDPAAAAFDRTVWAEKGAWLEELLVQRLPRGADPLYVATLATTIMNCFAAAERSWAAARTSGAPVDAADVTDFHRQLDRALAYAEHGWVVPSEPSLSADPPSSVEPITRRT
ncbi:TetR/AcrR family transcriptional regulator [Nostocoides sp. F2B08]|uniref:TetR/AcrR family transcriptional regulator n=1 Tax=Nostocoides sp. F2B08 TaxID=2653936 RepID=UPI00186B05DD|nr:TetR/AcrR family transcriptional regulator [Tetrasphaera sp. F2B08]